MNSATIILAAAQALKQQGCVAKGTLALDKKGKPCSPHSARAKRLDALGMLYRVRGVKPEKTAEDKYLPAALAHLDWAALLLFKKPISVVNDEHGYEAVLDCYRQAWASSRETEEPA